MTTSTAAATITLPTNLAEYPSTLALREGRITSDLVTLDYQGPKAASSGFKDMIRNEKYLAGELAIVTYLQAKCWDKPWVLLPFAVSGRTQHHCIGYNRELGVISPKDIEGRKVGVRSYAQTTGLWVRGILKHEYGVDLDKVEWLTVVDGHLTEYSDPANCTRLPAGSSLADMMMNGEIAAALMGNEMPKDDRIATLVPDAMAEGARWAAREGYIPINHMFVVHKDHASPEVLREIFRMLKESREAAPEAVQAKLPGIGLEANRKGIQAAIDLALEQKIIPRRLSVDELFAGVPDDLLA
ncbi:phosphate ABC transporter substrate-binding protein [Novosphingobium flavum]|uniref:Phosphate ABC transporter substrate-binding protein n=1 Tax=Novosphingobium flavum TaxID=1778672 RepID=A0A7X1FV18_9SPHN|nr:phosphate ABC transporter substrate-binding protein [Novosphingobium flavum]MBC2667519.1 phosphate ABC transporter substrate-binding protein [Novosphingobium flavum]